MNKQKLFIVATLALLLPISTAVAQSPAPELSNSDSQRQQIAEQIFRRLDLNPNQDKKMREFLKEHRTIGREMQSISAERKELYRLLRSSIASDEEVRAQADRTTEKFISIQKKRLEMMLQVKKILRPEQFERLLQLMAKARQKTAEKNAAKAASTVQATD